MTSSLLLLLQFHTLFCPSKALHACTHTYTTQKAVNTKIHTEHTQRDTPLKIKVNHKKRKNKNEKITFVKIKLLPLVLLPPGKVRSVPSKAINALCNLRSFPPPGP